MSSIFTNILLVQSFGLHSRLTWNAPSWSISVEFYTYLVFALLVLAGRGRIAMASALAALGGMLVVAIFSHDNIRTTFDYGFFRCLYGFFVGVLLYRLYHAGEGRRFRALVGPTTLEVGVVLAVALFVALAGARPISLLSPLIFGAAVYVFALERGAVSRLLLTRLFRAVGARSYSIYMTHALLLIAMARIIRVAEGHLGEAPRIDAAVDSGLQSLLWLGSDWRSDALVVLYLASLLAIASFTYRYIENPGRAYFNAVALAARRGLHGAIADGRSAGKRRSAMGPPARP